MCDKYNVIINEISFEFIFLRFYFHILDFNNGQGIKKNKASIINLIFILIC